MWSPNGSETVLTVLYWISNFSLPPEHSLWAAAANGCDAFVTSDLKYNQFLDAGDLGLTAVDAGHFPTEDVICPVLVQYLKEKFPGIPVEKSASHREAVQYYV